MKVPITVAALILATLGLTGIASAQLPDPGVTIVDGRTALLITDPQNDFLSPKGVAWGVVGKSVTENNTVQNIDSLFAAAKANDIPVFISPHYYYPTDHGWQFEGALEALMHQIGMFDRKGALSTEGFEGSGADWLEQYKKYIAANAAPFAEYQIRTRSSALKRTTWFCNCESAVSTKSFSAVCRPTSAPNHTCVN